jgi:hypothetical protein
VHQFLPVTLLLSLEEALIFLHGHDDHMRPAPAFDDNDLVILHSVPHQFAKADTRLSSTYHTAHIVPHQSIDYSIELYAKLTEKSRCGAQQ